MPINPSIPLQVEPPKPISLVDSWEKAQQLNNSRQLGQQNDMKLQQMRQDNSDQEVIRRAYMQTGADPKEFVKRLKSSGIAPQTVMSIEKSINDTLAAERERALRLDDTTRKQEMDRYDQLRGILIPIDEEKDDAKAAGMFQKAYEISKVRGWTDDKTEKVIKLAMGPGFSREGLKVLNNSLSTATDIHKEAEKELRAQATMMRAQSYAQNIDARIEQTDFKNDLSRQRLELDIKDYERLLVKDDSLDDLSRLRIRNTMEIARMRIKQERENEAGRNTRLDKTLANRTANIKVVQDRVDSRYGEAISKKMVSPSQVASAVSQSLKQMGYETLDDIDADELPDFQGLVDSYLSRQVPEFGKRSSGLFNMGSSTVVTPSGNEVTPQSTTTKTTGGGNAQGKPAPNKTDDGWQPTRLQLDDNTKKAMKVDKWYPAKGSKGTTIYIKKMSNGSVVETTTKPAGL
jgi:hypothetical protein